MDERPESGEILPARTLEQIGAELREATANVDKYARATIEEAIRSGELLIEAKPLAGGHGHWLPWLATYFGKSESTANVYMRLARHKDEIRSATDLRGALRLIAGPEEPKPPGNPVLAEARRLLALSRKDGPRPVGMSLLASSPDALDPRPIDPGADDLRADLGYWQDLQDDPEYREEQGIDAGEVAAEIARLTAALEAVGEQEPARAAEPPEPGEE